MKLTDHLLTGPELEDDISEFRSSLTRVIYCQDGFAILAFHNRVVAKGSMLSPRVGLEYTMRGSWTTDPKYGRQFKFDEYRAHLPQEPSAIAAYLAEQCDFVGSVIADRIVQAFGDSALEIMKNDPERVAREIPGLTPNRAQILQAHLREIEDSEAMEIDLKEILTGTKITKRAINQIKAKWRHAAAEHIRHNPYMLIEAIDGVGFATADAIAKKVGIAHEAPERIRAGVLHVLKESSWSGHVCLPREKLVRDAAGEAVLNLAPALVRSELGPLQESKAITSSSSLTEEYIYLTYLYKDERYIALKLRALLACPARTQAVPSTDGLHEDQAEAVVRASQSTVFVITGAPGTGKTTLERKIIDSVPAARVALCAPTGKAARRMAQQAGREATTIHRLLGPEKDRLGFKFRHNETDPVPVDLVVCDEVSMLDTTLAAAFLRAIAPGTRLVLVGDTHQLPSVGPGNILSSILASGIVPSATLTKIKRQDPGLIITNCHKIKDGQDIQADNESKDFFVMDRREPHEIADTIVDLISRRLARAYNVDPLREIQVICALREKTELSCKALNELLQAKLNMEPVLKWTRFRLDDKVIQLKNEAVTDMQSGEGCMIANGDIGYVKGLSEETKSFLVEFENPTRIVSIKAHDSNLDLAYAVTVHKFQGSEAPIIVIPIHSSAGSLILQRPWIYTAVSRASRVCILVGERHQIPKIIARNRHEVRYTRLVDFLLEKEGEGGRMPAGP